MRSTALWVLLAGVLAAALPAQTQPDFGKDYKEACDRLVCQCGCSEQLSVCAMQNCSSAVPMRAGRFQLAGCQALFDALHHLQVNRDTGTEVNFEVHCHNCIIVSLY